MVRQQSGTIKVAIAVMAATLVSLPLSSPGAQSLGQQPVIRVSSTLVMVPVSVTDGTGSVVGNLQPQDFRLQENGRTEQIAKIFEPGKTPLELALLFDVSGSVNPRFQFEQEAAMDFVRKTVRPSDTLLILSVGEEPRVVQPRTSSIDTALRALGTMAPSRSMTAFFDSIVMGTRLMRRAATPETRRVEIVISDGEDNNSSAQFDDALLELQRTDCIFYAINPSGPSVHLNQISVKGHESMQTLATQTGGAAFLPESDKEFDAIFQQISKELQAQYLLGYYPSNAATDGSFRRIMVTVPGRSDLRIRARQGYYSPRS